MRSRLNATLGLLILCLIAAAPPAAAQVVEDLTRRCGAWTFAPDLEIFEGPEPAAYLPCGEDDVLIVTCILDDFIAGLRYYGPAAEAASGYRLFRFTAGDQAIDFYLRLEEADLAWAGYREFDHPLFAAIASAAGPLRISDGRNDMIVPLAGSARALAGLREYCASR
jgi:hypothetical protein